MRNFIGVIFAAGVVAPSLGAQQQVPGWVVEQKTSMTIQGAPAQVSSTETRMRVTLAAGDMRMDFLEGPTAGEYAVLPAKGPVMLLVVPARRVARELPRDPAALSGIVAPGATFLPGAMKLDTLGDGPVMLGYPTRHYRVTPTRLTGLLLPGLGGDSTERTSLAYVMDYYVTEQLPMVEAAGFQQRMRPYEPGEVLWRTGIPLRTETHMEMGSGGMKTISVTEVTSVSQRDVDPALFTVPADYAHVSFVAEMRELQARTDSMMKSMARDFPEMAAELKAKRDSMMGIRDTTKSKKP